MNSRKELEHLAKATRADRSGLIGCVVKLTKSVPWAGLPGLETQC